MADQKPTQPGKTPQPEQQKNPQMPAQKPVETKLAGSQMPAANEQPLTEAQKLERQKAIDEAVAKAVAEQANKPKVDVSAIAKKAIEEVQAKRAKELLNPPAPTADGVTPSGKLDRWPDRKKRSSIANPVNFVHELADAMIKADPTVRRKDVIEAAIEAGVAGYTARTQYQEWYKNRRESQKQAALTQAKQDQQKSKTA